MTHWKGHFVFDNSILKMDAYPVKSIHQWKYGSYYMGCEYQPHYEDRKKQVICQFWSISKLLITLSSPLKLTLIPFQCWKDHCSMKIGSKWVSSTVHRVEIFVGQLLHQHSKGINLESQIILWQLNLDRIIVWRLVETWTWLN